MQGSQAPQPDTRKPAVPLTPPQRKSADPKPESKQAENAPSSSHGRYFLVQLRAKLSWHRLQGHLATSWLLRRPSQLTNSFFETLCRPIRSANLADVESQLELQLEGRTAVDHIPDGLSTLSQYLLYRQQLLDNPFPNQWVMAPWQALRSNAARTALVRKYQRPSASLKDPERFRCAQFLLSLFPEPVTDNTIGQEEFFGFVNCILQSRLNYETWKCLSLSQCGRECRGLSVQMCWLSRSTSGCTELAPLGPCHHGNFGYRKDPSHGSSSSRFGNP